MTFGEMKTAVALAADNMQSDHPIYSSLGSFINEAANKVLLMSYAKDRRAGNCFPELQDTRRDDVTANGEAELDFPSTLLIMDRATCTRTTTAYDPSTQQEYPMSEVDASTFSLLNRSATGWPVLWTRHGNVFSYWPTCSSSPTDYRTRIVIYGTKKELPLTSDSQSFVMNSLWHPTVVKCAVGITMQNMGEHERAEKWILAAEKDVTATINIVGSERMNNRINVGIAGTPR